MVLIHLIHLTKVRDGKIGPEDLRVIAQSDPIPYCVFGVAPGVPDDKAARIRSLLLNLLPGGHGGRGR